MLPSTAELQVIVTIEADIAARMRDMTRFATDLALLLIRHSSGREESVELLQQGCRAALEQYLNAVDRVAWLIINGFAPDFEWRSEYGDFIHSALFDNAEYIDSIPIDQRWDNLARLVKQWES